MLRELQPRIWEYDPSHRLYMEQRRTKAIGSTPCPDCGLLMVYQLRYEKSHPYADSFNPHQWHWSAELDEDLTECRCEHFQNVIVWEGQRVIELVKATNRRVIMNPDNGDCAMWTRR